MSYASLEGAIRAGRSAEVYDECRAMLAEITEGGRPLLAVRHPLGFVCLPVVRDGDLGVCIHVWTSRLDLPETTTSSVHCHSWELVSFVLYGFVSHTLLRVEDDAAGDMRVFEVRSAGDTDEIVGTGRVVRYTEESRETTGAGGSYGLAAGQFHTSVVDHGTEAATVVLGRTRELTDLTIAGRDLADHSVRREQCTPAETVMVARAADGELDVLTASGGGGSPR